MMGLRSFDELKALLQPRVQRERWSCSFLPSGLPKGAITEISGSGKTELTLRFLAENPELKVAWVEGTFCVYPFAFLQRQVSLDRVLFVEGGKETSWCVLQLLKSQTFAVVVVYVEKCELANLRRWQLTAEKSQAAVIWLSPRPQRLWPVSLQISTHRQSGQEEELQVSILRQR